MMQTPGDLIGVVGILDDGPPFRLNSICTIDGRCVCVCGVSVCACACACGVLVCGVCDCVCMYINARCVCVCVRVCVRERDGDCESLTHPRFWFLDAESDALHLSGVLSVSVSGFVCTKSII
jgi:hypothetical protein